MITLEIIPVIVLVTLYGLDVKSLLEMVLRVPFLQQKVHAGIVAMGLVLC